MLNPTIPIRIANRAIQPITQYTLSQYTPPSQSQPRRQQLRL